MRFSNSQKIKGELAARGLSKQAKKFYEGTDHRAIYEVEHLVDEDEDGFDIIIEKRYYLRGAVEADNLTFEEMDELLAYYQDELDQMDEEEAEQ